MEANFLLNKAYRYTSITSVTLLDCASIPGVLLLTKLLLGARYRVLHYIGAAVCIGGLALLVVADDAGAQRSSDTNPLLGDVLVLIGALLYALGNVAQEHLLGHVSNAELLALLGVFGSIFSLVQAGILEHSALRDAPWNWQMFGPLLLYVTTLLAFYSLVPVVLRLGGAAVLNLSLLSSDLWAAAARVAFFGGFSGTSAWVFFGSLGMVAAGIVTFSAAGEVNAAPAPATGLTHAGDAEADGDDFSEQSINGSRNMDALERGGELTRLWAGPDSQQAS
jgi:solute carrier family 35 protein F1/2